MCPIETPEGPNIGLISYLASFARINEYGFIEAPYRRVDKETGVVTDEVVYMTADVEDMGSNMQRQAVPLLKTESPIVGTGMEYKACLDSGVAVVSKNAGVVESVDADKIVIREDSGMLRTYELTKFKRSNAGTCTNQRPIVNKGERIEANQIIGDYLLPQTVSFHLVRTLLSAS